MAVPDRLAAAALATAALVGCTGNPGPQLGSEPSEAARQIAETKAAAGEAETTPPPTEPPPEATPAEPEKRSMVLRDGDQFEAARVAEPKDEKPSLWEASQAEQRRRQETDPSKVVITDANLKEYAERGRLTELVTEPLPATEEPTAEEPDVDPEAYWRQRVRDARLAWRAAADRVEELEARIAELRYDFYAQDDPYYRDSEIKPAWDRAVLDLERAEYRVEERRLNVDLVLQAGHREGALPGWLREGLEFEPQPREAESSATEGEISTVDAIDAPVVEEPPS